MAYKAVFFDRDGTLTYSDPKVKEQIDNLIISWGGKPFPIVYDKMIELFETAARAKSPGTGMWMMRSRFSSDTTRLCSRSLA